MPGKPSITRIRLMKWAGFGIMVADFIAMGYWTLAMKPRVIAKMAAGQWSLWAEILDKLIIIGFGAIGYIGYAMEVLPENEWNWKRAVQSGVEAVISGLIFGALYALMSR